MGIVTHHVTDEAGGLGQVRRRIANWQNYRTPSGIWAATDVDVEEQGSPPPDWTGGYEFTHACLRNPLQAFVGDSTDPANTALIGLRLSWRPECWVNFKAVGVNAVNMVVDRPNRRVAWPLLWAQSDLGYDLGKGRIQKGIRLRAPGHPTQFRFAVRLPAGFTHEIVNNSLRLKDSNGVEFMHSPPAWGEDATGKAIVVQLLAGQPVTFKGVSYPTIRLVPSATDLATATYPVLIDPTTTISGTTDTQDASIYSGSSTGNYGRASLLFGKRTGGLIWRTVLRISASAIPAGTLTAFRLLICRSSYGDSTVAGTLDCYCVKNANTWVEGNSAGADESGSCSWAYTKWNTQGWAGSSGCGTIGTDYDNETPASYAYDAYSAGDPAWHTVALKTAWATAWRDATRTNNGFFVRSRSETQGDIFYAYASENGTYPLYFEIDYSSGGPQLFMSTYRRRRS